MFKKYLGHSGFFINEQPVLTSYIHSARTIVQQSENLSRYSILCHPFHFFLTSNAPQPGIVAKPDFTTRHPDDDIHLFFLLIETGNGKVPQIHSVETLYRTTCPEPHIAHGILIYGVHNQIGQPVFYRQVAKDLRIRIQCHTDGEKE